MRKPISAEEKLAVTLRYLATGESFHSLKYQYRIHHSTIAQFIVPVCSAIYKVLAPDYMKVPQSEDEWNDLINKTDIRWQFPNAYAAADGKHIGILCPCKSGSDYYNYKGFYSVVLLAFVDYDYKFLIAEVGCQGRISDGGVYRNSQFYKMLCDKKLNLPPARALPRSTHPFWQTSSDSSKKIPMVFVADDAFPLSVHCMKPFAKRNQSEENRIFNYRLSRLRRVTENAFGIWVNRFRLFATKASLSVEKVDTVIMASLALHNMLRTKSAQSYTPLGFIDQEDENSNFIPGDWRTNSLAPNLADLEILPAQRVSSSGEEIRTAFLEYFAGSGQVSWQWNMLFK